MKKSDILKILFVCKGNICRSPAAENIFNYYISKYELEGKIKCDSAGIDDEHEGQSPDRRLFKALKKQGIDTNGKARQIKRDDFDKFDYLIVMDDENYQELKYFDKFKEKQERILKMANFCTKFKVTEIPDPYYKNLEAFEYVVELLLDGCQELLKYLKII